MVSNLTVTFEEASDYRFFCAFAPATYGIAYPYQNNNNMIITTVCIPLSLSPPPSPSSLFFILLLFFVLLACIALYQAFWQFDFISGSLHHCGAFHITHYLT